MDRPLRSPLPRWAVACGLALTLVSIGACPAGGGPVPAETTPSTAGRNETEVGARRLAEEFRAGVETLAADSMEGRGIGTAGIRRAADWIEARLRAAGLEPAFGSSYRQSFRIKTGVRKLRGNRLDSVSDTAWVPLGFSSSGAFSGEIAFLGYGIEAPSIGYRELEGVDLRGKVALMLRYEPQEKDEASPFDGKRPSRWSALRYKAHLARERGAVAVLFVTGPLQDEGQDKLPALRNDGPESPAGIPILQVKTSVAARWLRRSGIDLGSFQKAVDRDLTPRSMARTGVRVRGRVALDATYADAENLAAILPGRGPLAGEAVVVGAHYDHLGVGGERSMRPNERAIHSGADDNASGTMGALLIGESLKRALAGEPSHRAVVVALFSGEEVGLAGSSHFVAHPPVSVERMAAMVNLDMIGRLRDGRLAALGADTAPEWSSAIERAAARESLTVSGRGDGYGPSDQTSFYAAGVPVLHLFTGAHEAYHTPDDKPATLNTVGAARVARFTSDLLADLAIAGARPTYVRAGGGPALGGDSRGYGAYLGTVPDYRAMESSEGGVLLADVRAGGPAERAGIRGGDRIVEMAGTRIANLYDMTYALQDHRAGETIDVVVVRDAKPVRLRATLGDRAAIGRDGAAPAPPPANPGVGAPGAAQAVPSAHAADPHAAVPGGGAAVPAGADTAQGSTLPPYYEGCPGPEFHVGAGKPFASAFDGERHLAEIRQLTFGGENAEAYFGPDGRHLIYQWTPRGGGCDQQYLYDLETGKTERVSSGKGRTTCGYYDWPEGDRIIYASTEAAADTCPPAPDRSQGYVWALYEGYDIYEALPDGRDARRMTHTPGYDAEATWCHRGGKLVFTSVRDGDLELYAMDEAGGVKRLTHTPGYDGGAFYSPDCSRIVWRASRPQGEALEEYRRLLAKGLVRPSALEIYLMNADGTGARQLTANGAANFCPTFLADGKRILYSSNVGSPGGREFDLWLVSESRGEPERITFAPGFDGFPHVSPDGRWLVWSSNRADPAGHETNLFIAKWLE